MAKIWDVFWRFLCLGCISFGGPAAHIGYFQHAFVDKLNWIDKSSYASLISLSQFLPGPGSSQVGFAIGLRHAGIWGGLAAFLGFTLPSFLLMYFIASASSEYQANPLFEGIVHGMKLLAVVVVTDAVITMYNSFCNNKLSISIALSTLIAMLILPSLLTQMSVLVFAAFIGMLFHPLDFKNNAATQRIQWLPLILFITLFIGSELLTQYTTAATIFAHFYHAGSLVFGGGHVVLPLLQQTLGDTISTDRFLLGYASAQAVPGPMFSIAAFIGADLMPTKPLLGAMIATLGIFVPGLLLVLTLQDAWQSMAGTKIAGAIWAINAAVVGLLSAALYNPVFLSAVSSSIDFIVIILGILTLRSRKVPILLLVFAFSGIGVLTMP